MCQKYENGFPFSGESKLMRMHNILRKVWPMPPFLALALLSLLPTNCYLNRGFTVWFHLMGVFYLLTQSQFIQKFQILIGTSICLGWYAALAYEYFYHGRFMDALHKNMPQIMVNVMVKDGNLDFNSKQSICIMIISHVLDLLGHPLLTYYFWRKHESHGGKLSEVFSWPVVISTYMYSRLWSFVHTYYNQGNATPFYVGFDVYVIDSLDAWYPAYISESLIFISIIFWKLFLEKKDSNDDSKKPDLVYSGSSVSIE